MKGLACNRIFRLIVFIILCLYPVSISADNSGKELFDNPKTLLIIDSEDSEPYESTCTSLIKQLAHFGYLEGRNLKIIHYDISNNKETGKDILKQELPKNYDAVLLNGTIITQAAKEDYLDKPRYNFIYMCVTDPSGLGIIDSQCSTPIHNFTGVSYPVPVESRLTFIKEIMPEVKRIGIISGDMPQSQSYRLWLDNTINKNKKFKALEIIYRIIPYTPGKDSSDLIKKQIKEYVQELDPLVDVFITPNDQLGTKPYYAQVIYEHSSKPLVGLTREEVMENHGAAMSIYPSHTAIGNQAAVMIKKIFEGRDFQEIPPESPGQFGFAFDLTKTERFNITVPIQYLQLAEGNIRR